MDGFDDYPVCWPTRKEIDNVLDGHARIFGVAVPSGKHIVARYCAALPAVSARTGMVPDLDVGPATAEDVIAWDKVFSETQDVDLMRA